MSAFILSLFIHLYSLDFAATPWCGLEIRAVNVSRGAVMLRNTCAEPDHLDALYLRWGGVNYGQNVLALEPYAIPPKGCLVLGGLSLPSGQPSAGGLAVFDQYQNVLVEQPIAAVTWGDKNPYKLHGSEDNGAPDLPAPGSGMLVQEDGKWSLRTTWPACW